MDQLLEVLLTAGVVGFIAVREAVDAAVLAAGEDIDAVAMAGGKARLVGDRAVPFINPGPAGIEYLLAGMMRKEIQRQGGLFLR